MELIFHYTNFEAITGILKEGEIKVSENSGINPPAVWLSLNPQWENSATKMIQDNGSARLMTKEEQHQKFGLYRFCIPFEKNKLCSWKDYKKKSNTPAGVYNLMELVALSDNSKPVEWYASFDNIPLSECIACEKWDGKEWKTFISLKSDH